MGHIQQVMQYHTIEFVNTQKWLMCNSKAFLLCLGKMTAGRLMTSRDGTSDQQWTLSPVCTTIRFQVGCNWPDIIKALSKVWVTLKLCTMSSMVLLTQERSVRAAAVQYLVGSRLGAALEQTAQIHSRHWSFSSTSSHVFLCQKANIYCLKMPGT